MQAYSRSGAAQHGVGADARINGGFSRRAMAGARRSTPIVRVRHEGAEKPVDESSTQGSVGTPW